MHPQRHPFVTIGTQKPRWRRPKRTAIHKPMGDITVATSTYIIQLHSALSIAIHFIFFDCMTVCMRISCVRSHQKLESDGQDLSHERHGLHCSGCSWNHHQPAFHLLYMSPVNQKWHKGSKKGVARSGVRMVRFGSDLLSSWAHCQS